MYLSPAGFGPGGQELRFGLITPVGIHDLGFPFEIPLREWTHLAVVLRGDEAVIYYNGRPVAARADVTSDPSDMGSTDTNRLGRSLFAADPAFDGRIDDVRVSCRGYDDREIAQLAHLPAPRHLPDQRPQAGDITNVHDPVIDRSGGLYRMFSTGPGVLTRTSSDLEAWTFGGSVFADNPAWVTDAFGPLDSLWAPDVSQFGGTHHLYYSASTFGSNRSCIGHATKDDLDSPEPWVDRGAVICSNLDAQVDDWNAIDPNVVIDRDGAPWLSFGSFWSGLKMIPLTAGGERAGSDLIALASRPGSTAVEAPFIVYQHPYYYLFASFDFCCRGSDSSYRIVVGRSRSVTGPYLDRTGLPMLEGGGTPVTSGGSRWRGPGHNAILRRGHRLDLVYHSYDALANGVPTLRISELVWHHGWPLAAEP
jgi:arabinan endo-1,5-alpha-L-arabinosidase